MIKKKLKKNKKILFKSEIKMKWNEIGKSNFLTPIDQTDH